jgi:ribokinase
MGRVVVLGSLNMDLVVNVPSLPAAGATVIGDRLRTFPGGKGGNQATAAACLGADVTMIGRVGADGFADRLVSELQKAGVNVDGVSRDAELPTGSALIVIDSRGRKQIAVAPGANYAIGNEELERMAHLLSSDAVLVLQLEIPVAVVRKAIMLARQAGAKVILNAAPATNATQAMVKGLDVLVVNAQEASQLLDTNVVSMSGARRAAMRAGSLGVISALVTLGAEGCALFNRGSVDEIPPRLVDAVDATGAGDAFVGALAAGLARDLPIQDVAAIAAAAGAVATTKVGAQSALATAADLKALFNIGWG